MKFRYGTLTVTPAQPDVDREALSELAAVFRDKLYFLATLDETAMLEMISSASMELHFVLPEEDWETVDLSPLTDTQDLSPSVECKLEEGEEKGFITAAQSLFITGTPQEKIGMREHLEDLRELGADVLTKNMWRMLDLVFAYRMPEETPVPAADLFSPEEEGGTVEGASDGDGDLDQWVAGYFQRLDALAGFTEFKGYMRELESMRTRLTRWADREDFPTQHLLFAIDSGNGCTTALEFLCEYVKKTGIHGRPKDNDDTYSMEERTYEYTADLVPPQLVETLDAIKSTMDYLEPGVLGIHLSEWLSYMETPFFLKFLEACWAYRSAVTFVFIVPYLEAGALARVQAKLNDVINVRLLHFHPYDDDELMGAVRETLNQFDVNWDDSVNPHFKHVLARERGDQRFYGMKTASKLSTELLLMKVRNSALLRTDAPEDLLTGTDFEAAFPQEDGRPGFVLLDELVGLTEVKKRVRELVASVLAERRFMEEGGQRPCLHMLFTGAPGTGKTTVARIIGKIFRENGLLGVGDLLEVNRFDLVGQYIGQTGPKTVALCKAAMGSILFIDEAYLLAPTLDNDRDFGREALGALVAEMENNRDRFSVVLAGYKEEMEKMLAINPGLRGRIPHQLHFPNYTKAELFSIFRMQTEKQYVCDDELLTSVECFLNGLSQEFMEDKEFGNARFVRNLVERMRMKAVLRMSDEEAVQEEKLRLCAVDLESALTDEDMQGINRKERMQRIGFIS